MTFELLEAIIVKNKIPKNANNYSVRKELESYGNFIRWADFIVKSSSEI